MNEYLNQLIKTYGKENLMIATGVVIVLIVLYFFVRKMRLKKRRKMVMDLENRVSAVKSLPISYRLGRVQNILKNSEDMDVTYEDYEKRYEEILAVQNDDIAILLNEVDEKLYAGKMWGVKKKIKQLEETITKYEKDANALLAEIEKVTEVENIQRVQIIRIKEKYRAVQETLNTVSYKLEEVMPSIKAYVEGIDQDFVDLEDKMNHQQFDEAKEACVLIDERIDFLSTNIRDLPTYISLASGYIPDEIEKIQNRIIDLKSRDFSLVRMDAENRVMKMQEALLACKEHIQALDISNVGEALNHITSEINTINDEFETEELAQTEFNENYGKIYGDTYELSMSFNIANEELEKLKKRYVLSDDVSSITKDGEDLKEILNQMNELKESIHTKEVSYQEVLEGLKQLASKSDYYDTRLQDFFKQRDEMELQEKRALDELENINIVLLEIKSQIKNKQLPTINESYKDYIADSYKKASEIQFLCKSRPIVLEHLSNQVDIARDIIYKLYENIHNLIVTADMVEEAIVFGNRYRSSFLEVNTELTKAEVLFRNGEYTKALTIAVDIIEKIKPGSYEKLIKKTKTAQNA